MIGTPSVAPSLALLSVIILRTEAEGGRSMHSCGNLDNQLIGLELGTGAISAYCISGVAR